MLPSWPTCPHALCSPGDTPLVQMISDDPATQQQTKKLNPIQQARCDFTLGKSTELAQMCRY